MKNKALVTGLLAVLLTGCALTKENTEEKRTEGKPLDNSLNFNYNNHGIRFSRADWEDRRIYFEKCTVEGYSNKPNLFFEFKEEEITDLELPISDPQTIKQHI